MKIKSIYVNLPIKDLVKTKEFWTKLGFTFNEDFSDDKALCLMLNEDSIFAMLISEAYFTTFTNRPISDGSTTQVLLAIEVDSKEEVDTIVNTALDNGGKRYRNGEDLTWMYYDSFEDIDGHQWEVLFTDISKLPQD
ncbi:MAG TPA: glyoxalase/bleomycin resistance/extradiol dioxygenase family protein [Candidatus Kapabacteria bacterium]|nr:glyoxalase/bleomycin resistance/extradiol dioxygenase family protein [Candidatus Kapabacteria bacterium]